jgi:transposase
MSTKFIRQCVGIDCSKDELVVAFGTMNEDLGVQIISNERFKNTPSGFKKLLLWSKKLRNASLDIPFVIEATGVYHEGVSLFLYQSGESISVMLPNKVKAFSKTLKVKTINDKTCAQAISVMGLEKKLEKWKPANEVFRKIKQLTREREQVIVEMTQIKNQIHAEESGAWPNDGSIKRARQRVRLLEKQTLEIEVEVKGLIEANKWLAEKVEKVCSIKGIGQLTVAVILGETDGFNLIRNKKQLASYAGLDVVERESGISVRGKTRISRKGNRHIRKALYFPALSAIRSSETMKNLFARLVARHGIKMKAAVAVQRKLLELIYVIWKNDTIYNPDYHKNKESNTNALPSDELAQGCSC